MQNVTTTPRQIKHVFLALLALGWLMESVSPALNNSSAYVVGSSVLMNFLPFAWTLRDADTRGQRPGYGFKLGLIAINLVFVPLHLLRTRGLWPSLRAGGLFLLQLLGIVVAVEGVMLGLAYAGLLPGGL